jgi:septal ring factor EnvC (AmiA/AmiB activator)
MKKIFSILFATMFLLSCGTGNDLQSDVKKLVDMKCKMKQSFNKIAEFNKQMQSIPQPDYTNVESVTKYTGEQKKIMDELSAFKKEDSKLAADFKKLESELKEKYKSDSDKEKLKKELATQLAASDCK